MFTRFSACKPGWLRQHRLRRSAHALRRMPTALVARPAFVSAAFAILRLRLQVKPNHRHGSFGCSITAAWREVCRPLPPTLRGSPLPLGASTTMSASRHRHAFFPLAPVRPAPPLTHPIAKRRAPTMHSGFGTGASTASDAPASAGGKSSYYLGSSRSGVVAVVLWQGWCGTQRPDATRVVARGNWRNFAEPGGSLRPPPGWVLAICGGWCVLRR